MRVGRLVGTVAFVSLALVPWWVLFFGWNWWALVAVVFWLVVGAVALFDAEAWERRKR
jgi:hypothetical protein